MADALTRPRSPLPVVGAAPAFAKPPALVAFDVDGTLVDDTIFVWETLHESFGTDRAARAAAQADYMAGRITYADWFEHDIRSLLALGADRDGMLAAIAGMRPMAGAHETLAALRHAGVVLVVISGSLDFVLDRLFPNHPFADVLINHVGFAADGRLAEWRPTPFDMDHKAAGLRHLAAKHGVPLERCAFVGDHFNDVEVARAAGLGIAFNCKSAALLEAADVWVDSQDLRDVLPHLLPDHAPVPGGRGRA